MQKSKIKNAKVLERAIDFHGHLGPYLVLGILAGEFALKKLKCKKYFGFRGKVFGADKKPKSCLIDGLQLSTGATFGKGNIEKAAGKTIKIVFQNRTNNEKIVLKLKDGLKQILEVTKDKKDSELLAIALYKTNYFRLFDLV